MPAVVEQTRKVFEENLNVVRIALSRNRVVVSLTQSVKWMYTSRRCGTSCFGVCIRNFVKVIREEGFVNFYQVAGVVSGVLVEL